MVERCNERFFNLPAGMYCGVLIREKAAKKLQKILWRHTQEIKDFLVQNMDSLECENWTIADCDDRPILYYYDGRSRAGLKDRISLFDKGERLSFVKDVFRTDKTYCEASDEVKEFYKEHYEQQE